jgi:hypothetical protein
LQEQTIWLKIHARQQASEKIGTYHVKEYASRCRYPGLLNGELNKEVNAGPSGAYALQ